MTSLSKSSTTSRASSASKSLTASKPPSRSATSPRTRRFNEGEILETEAKIRNAEIIATGSGDVVQMGSTVVVIDQEFAEDGPETFMIVGSTEADPDEGKISNESPLGQALLGQKVGSVVDVHAPAGIIKYEIQEIKG